MKIPLGIFYPIINHNYQANRIDCFVDMPAHTVILALLHLPHLPALRALHAKTFHIILTRPVTP